MGRIRGMSGALTCSSREGYRPETHGPPSLPARNDPVCGPFPESRPAAGLRQLAGGGRHESGDPGARRASREERPGPHARRRAAPRRRLSAGGGRAVAGPAAAHALFEERSRRGPPVQRDRRARLRGGGSGHPRPLHLRRRRRPARRGRRWVRFGAVGRGPARSERAGGDVRRQLSRHHPAGGRDPAAARARGAVSRLVLQPAPRHGVPGRRVLPERRARLEPRAGHGRPPARPDARRRSRRPHRPVSGPVGATTVNLAVAPAAEVVQRVRPRALRARLPPDAVAPRRRRVLGAGRHREPARSFRGAGVPPHRLVRHAADRHAAQLRGIARARGQRDGAALPAPGGGPLDPRAPDPRVHEDRRRGLRRRRRLRVRRSDDRLVRPLVEGRRPRRRGDGAHPPVRDGREPLARRAGLATGARAHHTVLPAERRTCGDAIG